MPCSRTQHGLIRVELEPPTSGSGVRGINHQATALPYTSMKKNEWIKRSNLKFFFFMLYSQLVSAVLKKYEEAKTRTQQTQRDSWKSEAKEDHQLSPGEPSNRRKMKVIFSTVIKS